MKSAYAVPLLAPLPRALGALCGAGVASPSSSIGREALFVASAAARNLFGLRSEKKRDWLIAAIGMLGCHGRAGSQQPTEPAEHPTVHFGQHVLAAKPARGSTQVSTWLRQHSEQTPEHPGASSQHVSSEEHTGAPGSEPHCCGSDGSNRADADASVARRAKAIMMMTVRPFPDIMDARDREMRMHLPRL